MTAVVSHRQKVATIPRILFQEAYGALLNNNWKHKEGNNPGDRSQSTGLVARQKTLEPETRGPNTEMK